MGPERVIRENSTDHYRQQNERDYDVGPENTIFVFTVHEYHDNEARLNRGDYESANDIPLAKIYLSRGYR
jgi:hypothetical protein